MSTLPSNLVIVSLSRQWILYKNTEIVNNVRSDLKDIGELLWLDRIYCKWSGETHLVHLLAFCLAPYQQSDMAALIVEVLSNGCLLFVFITFHKCFELGHSHLKSLESWKAPIEFNSGNFSAHKHSQKPTNSFFPSTTMYIYMKSTVKRLGRAEPRRKVRDE